MSGLEDSMAQSVPTRRTHAYWGGLGVSNAHGILLRIRLLTVLQEVLSTILMVG